MQKMLILAAVWMTMLSPFMVGAENTMIVGGQLMPLGPTDLTSASNALPTAPAPTLAPGLSKPQTVFREVPSISGEYSVAGTTVMPYVGAGFTNGYATDLDRSLHLTPSASSTDTGLRGTFGPNMAPSEFQWGVRIPF